MSLSLCPYRDEDVFPLSLGEPIEEALRAHLEGCPVCRERLERFRSEATTLRQAAEKLSSAVEESRAGMPGAVGKYYLVGLLGATPRAEFYRGMHPQLSKEVVIRLDRQSLDGDAQGHDRFLREARLLAELSQPNLARVRDANFHDGRPFLVLDVQAEPLAWAVRDGPLPPARAAALVARLARAVAAAHTQGAAARTLTPATVLLDDTGEPWLIDLGVHGGPDHDTAAAPRSTGSRERAPPAQRAADLHSLAELLYVLLVGREPFPGRAAVSEADRVGQRKTAGAELRRAGVPGRLEGICLRAMTASSDEGYASVADLAADLERFWRPAACFKGIVAGALALLLLVVGWWLVRP